MHRLRIPILLSALGLLVAFGLATFAGPPGGTMVANVPRAADFLSFWGGATVLETWDPARLYDHALLWKVMHGAAPTTIKFQNMYPPPLYQAVRPLLPLGYATASQLHLALMTGWMLGALALLVRACPSVPAAERRWVWGALAVSPVVYMNLLTGQLGGVWLSLLAGGVLLMRGGRPVLGGVVLGLLSSKPSVGAAVAAALLLCGQGRALGGFTLGGAALLAGSLALDGLTPWRAWAEMMTGDRIRSLFVVPQRQLTFGAALAFPLKGTAAAAWAHRLGTVIMLGAAAWLSRGARLDPGEARWPLRFGLVLSAMLLALPHMVDYDLALHGLGLIGSVALLRGARRPWVGAALLLGVFVTPVLHSAYRLVHLAGGGALLAGWLLWAATEVARQPAGEAVRGSAG